MRWADEVYSINKEAKERAINSVNEEGEKDTFLIFGKR